MEHQGMTWRSGSTSRWTSFCQRLSSSLQKPSTTTCGPSPFRSPANFQTSSTSGLSGELGLIDWTRIPQQAPEVDLKARMLIRHLAGARAVKVLVVAVALCALGPASRLAAQEFPSDVNTIRTDLGDAYQRDFFIYHNDLFPGFLLHTKEHSIGLFR